MSARIYRLACVTSTCAILCIIGLFMMDMMEQYTEADASPPMTDPPAIHTTWQECADGALDRFDNVSGGPLYVIGEAVHALGVMQYELAVCDRTFPEGME